MYVFEKFRNNRLNVYGSRLSHYSIEPTLSWNAVLNMTNVELEIIPCADMCIFFKKGMRGDIVKPTISN